uniref:DUF1618 domain-containing protein n=1 Tax=Leersia perrieri TaxID=77586 RepID=A0A0D9XG97_9ORYZ
MEQPPWHHSQLRPPSHGDSSMTTSSSWLLLDIRAYIDDRRNSTTCFAVLIQVTFCFAPPPLISYICIWSSTADPVEFFEWPPMVESVNADLVFIRIRSNKQHVDDLVYQDMDMDRDVGSYNICIFDSVSCRWNSHPISLDELKNPPAKEEVLHLTEKTIYLGGEQLAFVYLWKGILICNELGNRFTGSYVMLPDGTVKLGRHRSGMNTRDIAIVDDRLTFVRLRTRYYSDVGWCWDLCTWSKPVARLDEEDWREDFMLDSCDLLVDEQQTRNIHLLPRLPDHPPMAKLIVAHSTICLTDANVIYIMGKVDVSDHRAVVLTINLTTRRLQEVSVFDSRVINMFDFSYMQSTISQYFTNAASGVNENLKRPGVFHAPYPHKQHVGNKPLQLDVGRGSETQDGDPMFLE